MLFPTFICASDDLFPFKLGEELFDNDVTHWYADLMSNLVTKADELKANSDIASVSRRMAKTSLNDLFKDEQLLHLAHGIYTKIQQDERVIRAFREAQEATQDKEPLNKRKAQWKEFRKVAAHQLVAIRKNELPDYKDPTPGSAEALTEIFERNKDLELSPKQQNYFIAYSLVLYTFRQNHRLIDPSTDSPNLLLHKKVTDPQS